MNHTFLGILVSLFLGVNAHFLHAQAPELAHFFAEGYSLVAVKSVDVAQFDQKMKLTFSKGNSYVLFLDSSNSIETPIMLYKQDQLVSTSKTSNVLKYEAATTGIFNAAFSNFEGEVYFLWRMQKRELSGTVSPL